MCEREEENLGRAKVIYENSSRGQTADVNNVARVKALANEGPLIAAMTTIESSLRIEANRRLAAADPR